MAGSSESELNHSTTNQLTEEAVPEPKRDSDIKNICDENEEENGDSEQLEQPQPSRTEDLQNGPVVAPPSLCDSKCLEQAEPFPENTHSDFAPEQAEMPPKVLAMEYTLEQPVAMRENEAKYSTQQGHIKKGRFWKGKNILRSLSGSTRILRSRSKAKLEAHEPATESAEAASNERRGKKKKRTKSRNQLNEFIKIKARFRYLLTRMRYEQNLIDAYSGEGWKGLSLEKIKPEKEIQRAKSEIFRCKLKIRDLFHRIDSSCAMGRIPEDLFDSEGEIDSEDIFCAKCGSKDVETDNDIILCDGSCERGFHQFCLEPPLLNEHVPPGDEGWLCPACECKVDCIDLLNESQGTDLSITDGWEKVFPKAAAISNKMDEYKELPSDDSEDDDYDPDEPDLKITNQGVESGSEESSSDESDFSSASEDLEAVMNNYDPDGPELETTKEGVESGSEESSSVESDFSSASEDLETVTNSEQYVGLPSDDPEDDDYDPDKLSWDEYVKQSSSSSDFTSDSEDLCALLKDDGPSVEGQSVLDQDSDLERPSNEAKRKSLHDGLSRLLDSNPGEGENAFASGRRHVERLDYKKLHDEAYGVNASSDSSDEEYLDTVAQKKRKSIAGKAALPSSSVKTSDAEDMSKERGKKDNECTPKRGGKKRLDVEGTSPDKSQKGPSDPGSSKSATKQRRLGEAATQRLLESFKINQYPDRGAKETLAKELGITFYQVHRWFENCRWSFRHSGKGAQVHRGLPGSESMIPTDSDTCYKVENEEKSSTPRSIVNGKGKSESSKTTTPRKRKVKFGNEETDRNVKVTRKKSTMVDLPNSETGHRSGRIRSRSGRTPAS